MIIIRLDNISKMYRLYDKPHHKLKEGMFRSLFRNHKAYHREFWALKDINMEIPKGKTVGIIGQNGSGKSSLLQIIAGIIQPTTGIIDVHGRISSLLELGAGFNMEFTGMENVFMQGAILGISKRDMEKRFSSITEFADIGNFIDQPVKIYSSGMYMRLAFAVAINVDPDILLVDEALAVGDVFFQQKCFRRLRQLQEQGCTIIMVSHDMSAVTHLCDQGILLSRGRVTFSGETKEAVHRYCAEMQGGTNANNVKDSGYDHFVNSEIDIVNASPTDKIEKLLRETIYLKDKTVYGNLGAEVLAVSLYNEEDASTDQFITGEWAILRCLVKLNISSDMLTISTHIYNRMGILVFACGNGNMGVRFPSVKIGDILYCELQVQLNLGPGEYTYDITVGEYLPEDPDRGILLCRVEGLGRFYINNTIKAGIQSPFYGMVKLPMEISSLLATGKIRGNFSRKG